MQQQEQELYHPVMDDVSPATPSSHREDTMPPYGYFQAHGTGYQGQASPHQQTKQQTHYQTLLDSLLTFERHHLQIVYRMFQVLVFFVGFWFVALPYYQYIGLGIVLVYGFFFYLFVLLSEIAFTRFKIWLVQRAHQEYEYYAAPKL